MTNTEWHAPNTGPPMKEMWAFVSRDREGRENAIAMGVVGVGMTQFVTGNAKTLALFKTLVLEHLEELERGGEQTIHLLRFTKREELDGWR
jgi:hypothetical protein